MRRLLLSCAASLLLYAAAFGFVLDRPLSLGLPRAQLDAKLARGAAIEGPKLVILAGSNGPYSHRCETIEPILGMPCVNAGVAVGISLDYMFARWEPLLHPGDVVYLPLEEAQYTVSLASSRLGPDAAMMARRDWHTLSRLPAQRWFAAFFAFDLRAAIMSVIETALVSGGFHDPRAEATGTTNAWGDHIGHTPTLAEASQSVLAAMTPIHASAAQVRSQAASRQIADFLAWAARRHVRAIGGLPTGFADSPFPPATVAAVRTLFESHGAAFLDPPNHGRYKRRDFFDTADHLNEPAQIAHSRMIAEALRTMISPVIAAAGSPQNR
jgi:hypothetical protein